MTPSLLAFSLVLRPPRCVRPADCPPCCRHPPPRLTEAAALLRRVHGEGEIVLRAAADGVVWDRVELRALLRPPGAISCTYVDATARICRRYSGAEVEAKLAQLLEAQASYAKWGFDAETTPNGEVLHAHLFQAVAIEWNRECSHEASRCRSADTSALYRALRRHRRLPRRDDAPHRRAAAGRR